MEDRRPMTVATQVMTVNSAYPVNRLPSAPSSNSLCRCPVFSDITKQAVPAVPRSKLTLPLALLCALVTSLCSLSASGAVLKIDTLSSRPDRVTGGDVLVRIAQDDDVPMRVALNGTDVTAAFQPAPDHARIGLVNGLRLGINTLLSGGVKLIVRNYPIAGPIVSGPHETPFVCTTQNFKLYSIFRGLAVASDETLGPALDADCSARTKVTYLYVAKGAAALTPLLNPAVLPADVATTTTVTGRTVPFVVRVETATIDRGIYQMTVLFDPTSDQPPSWRMPPRGWNRRLVAVQGFGCAGGWYFQGLTGGSMAQENPGNIDSSLYSLARLGEGYALYGNTLQNASQNCNAVLEGEVAMMGKEHFIKEFGVPDFTVSVGCSGGSYGSAQPADALPGLYDGILIACTFPDPLAIATSGLDGHLLTHYFAVKAPHAFTESQQVAISGYKGMSAFLDAANQAGRTDPVPGRVDIADYKSAVWRDSVPAPLRYDPDRNPKGARPTIYDHARNILGIDPATGFARRTFDNVGVQYGLEALDAGVITAAEFIDLNAAIGGYDQDTNYVAKRSVGDVSALRRAYQSGLELSGGGGLASIPVVDISGIYDEDAGYHYQWFHFALRARMTEANGDLRNYVMWRGDPVPFERAWRMFISWVDAIHADAVPGSARDKAIRDRPTDAVDGCWMSSMDFVAEPQSFSREGGASCSARFPSYGFPRLVAGGPLAADILKCRLKPIASKDYAGHLTGTDLERLRRVFPNGVCDWSKSGIGHAALVRWASFGPAS
jgi:Tannase-like family of unknown function (DUF6351)